GGRAIQAAEFLSLRQVAFHLPRRHDGSLHRGTLPLTDEELSRFTVSRRSGVPSVSGDRVRICRGRLAGLTGAVIALRPEQKCVVKIDAGDGVYVVIDDAALERTEG